MAFETDSDGRPSESPEARTQPTPDSPFLPPIEEPEGGSMKQFYAMYRQVFGKVITPVRVHSARLPPAFGELYSKVSLLDRDLLLPPETALLIREQVARINVCLFCIDSDRWAATQASVNEAKFD